MATENKPTSAGSGVKAPVTAVKVPTKVAPSAPVAKASVEQPVTVVEPREVRTVSPMGEKTAADSGNGGDETPLEKRSKMLYIIGIVVSLVVLVASVGLFYFRLRQRTAKTAEVTTEVVEEEVEETQVAVAETSKPTPLPVGDISLEVLNGSGVAGEAGRVAETFESIGYEIAEIGNADATSGSKLYVKDEIKDLVDLLLGDVKDELDIDSITGNLDDADADARIVLGS